MRLGLYSASLMSLAFVAALVSGCADGGLKVAAKADVNLDRALPIAATQPLPIQISQPIQVRIEGLAVDYEGTFVTEQLFNMVQVGSSSEYARAIYGQPDEETVLQDGSSIWKYNYRPTSAQGSIFSVFAKKEDQPKPEYVVTLVFIKDDKVTGKWRG